MSKSFKHTAVFLLVVMMLVFVSSNMANAQAGVWACDWSGNLYTVNTSNASLSFIGSTGVAQLGALEFGPNGTLYGISAAGGPGSSLYAIDPNSAVSTFIGSLGFDDVLEGGLTFSPSGTAYAVEHFQGTPFINDLVTVDVSTGVATDVAQIGTSYHDINGLVWRSDGMLVGIGDDPVGSIVSIDPTTGAYSVISATSFSLGALGGMTTDQSSGTNYLGTSIAVGGDGFAGSNSLYSFDAFTGATSYIGTFSGSLDDVAGISGLAWSGPSTVPEPATMGLFGLGLAGLAMYRRKRSK